MAMAMAMAMEMEMEMEMEMALVIVMVMDVPYLSLFHSSLIMLMYLLCLFPFRMFFQ